MRIVAGTARGRTLRAPKNDKIRPTADRVRETIFNLLGQTLPGGEVLDLFAGTGALALEALSRGATRAVLVDNGREAIELCRANASALGFQDRVRVLALPVDRALKKLRSEGAIFDLIFADPPYAALVATHLLEKIVENQLLASGGIACIEHDKRERLADSIGGLVQDDARRFGDTVVSFYRTA